MLQLRSMKIAKKRKLHSGLKPERRVLRPSPKVADSAGLRAKKRKIAEEVLQYIDERGITRPQLEKMIKRGESTMNHFFTGEFAPSLLRRIERALNHQFGESSSVAPVEWGQYTREGTAKLVGSYLTLRNDFKEPSQVRAYVTTIEWSSVEHAHTFDGQLVQKPKVDGYGLVFREERRFDERYTHRGQVWLPGGSFLYLVTAYGDGRLRAAIASLPDNNKMSGIQLSLHHVKGPAFLPAASPIVFIRRDKIADSELGDIKPGHPQYDDYKRLLTEAIGNVVFATEPKT
jgi:hypothetical protein